LLRGLEKGAKIIKNSPFKETVRKIKFGL
jgi:hypothetical protein